MLFLDEFIIRCIHNKPQLLVMWDVLVGLPVWASVWASEGESVQRLVQRSTPGTHMYDIWCLYTYVPPMTDAPVTVVFWVAPDSYILYLTDVIIYVVLFMFIQVSSFLIIQF